MLHPFFCTKSLKSCVCHTHREHPFWTRQAAGANSHLAPVATVPHNTGQGGRAENKVLIMRFENFQYFYYLLSFSQTIQLTIDKTHHKNVVSNMKFVSLMIYLNKSTLQNTKEIFLLFIVIEV